MTPLSLQVLCLIIAVSAEPDPRRIPKVYNALITSNQNLEPSKAYPVYQPVLHDPFAFPFQPAVFYNGDFLNNGLLPSPGLSPKSPPAAAPAPPSPSEQPPPEPSSEAPTEAPATETESSTPSPSNPEPDVKANSPSSPPPLPPSTESPIPLNEFGLPPQVLPLGRFDPAYDGFTQVGPFTYNYPGLRFYDPYDPFSFSPYAGYPLYRPSLLPPSPLFRNVPSAVSPAPIPAGDAQTPPPEPSDLNLLNYASKDPAIPNVPPPPLPQGGLRTDNAE